MKVKLYQRGEWWWVSIHLAGRRLRRPLGTKSAAVARKALRKVEEELASGVDPFAPVAKLPTFTEHSRSWLERMESGKRSSTMEGYRRAVHEARRVIGTKRLDEITRKDARLVVETLRVSPRGRPRARLSVLNLVVGLQGCFTAAIEDGLILANPFARAQKLLDAAGIPRREAIQEDEDVLPQPYDHDERETLLSYLRTNDFEMYVACLLGLRAGLRRSEVLAPGRRHVDLEGRQILVRQRSSRGKVEVPKSARSRRDVPASSDLLVAVRELMQRNDETALGRDREPSELLFVPRYKTSPTMNERRF